MQTATDRERIIAAYVADCSSPHGVPLNCAAGLVIVIANVAGEQPESEKLPKVAMHETVKDRAKSGSARDSGCRTVY